MKNERFWNLAGMTKVFALLVSAIAIVLASVSCGSDVETEYKDKVYASAVTFDSTASDGTVTVTMKSATEGAEIYYTTDGTTTPNTESTKYSEPVSCTADTTIMAIAVKKGILNSPVSYAKVSIAEKKIIEQKEVEKTVEKEVDKKADETAPADVTNLAALSKDGRVLLTWTDAADSDIYGYEVTYAKKDGSRVVLPALDSNAIMVANGLGGCYVNNLTNETEYTFTVKTVDTSGNKSEGQSVSAKPQAQDASQALAINLSTDVLYHQYNSGTTKVTVNISLTSPSTIKKVVYKKDGSINAKKLLADTSATEATKGVDDKIWSFEMSAKNDRPNGVYTIAAIDEAGREEAEQITIKEFDFTEPPLVTGLTAECPGFGDTVTVSWTASDPDIDHVEISYTYNDGTSDSVESDKVVVSSGVTSKDFTVKQGAEASAKTYKYYVYSVDAAGNKSCVVDNYRKKHIAANIINVAVVSGVTAGYKFHDTVEYLPVGETDGSAGTTGTYVYFGDFPQTIKDSKVIIDKTITKTIGDITYYKGSDDFWYAECYENAHEETLTYSNYLNPKTRDKNSIQYFRAEPIKWRVLSESYDHDLNPETPAKKLLLAEKVLNSGIKYDLDGLNNGSYGKANDYICSYMRKYLNGLASGTYEDENYNVENKGFLQSAFSASAQNLIATTTVDNSNETYEPYGKTWYEGTDNTNDKIFLLSYKDLVNENFGFGSNAGQQKSREVAPTDYAVANNFRNDCSCFTRTPTYYRKNENYNDYYYLVVVRGSGDIQEHYTSASVVDTCLGIRPALCLE